MDKLASLRQLARDIALAADDGDWQAVAAADAAIAAALAAAPGDAEPGALAALRAAHAGAMRQCARAVEAAREHVSAMQANREGWIAYALDSNTNLDGTAA